MRQYQFLMQRIFPKLKSEHPFFRYIHLHYQDYLVNFIFAGRKTYDTIPQISKPLR